ncbi:MAG TPA: autotransporter-associated beta strand repeat-containing protein [Gemmatales bacterium]|nr:autotransporter-associated beta strand repeat-containing protein [Gemmatales bacterium]
MRTPSIWLHVGLVTLVALLGTAPAQAQVSASWNLDANGAYGTAGNWNPATVPDFGGVATFGGLGPNFGLSAGRTITPAAATLSGITFNTPFFYTIAAGATFTAQSGTAFNLTSLDYAGHTPTLFGFGANVSNVLAGTPTSFNINGGGSVLLSNTGNTFTAPIVVSGGTSLWVTNGNNATLGNAANSITLDNGIFSHATTALTTGRNFTIAQGGGTFRVLSAVALVHSGALTGTGTLTRQFGGGPLQFSGSVSGFTGDVVNQGGQMTFAGPDGLGGTGAFDATGIVFLANATNNANRFDDSRNLTARGAFFLITPNAAGSNEVVGNLVLAQSVNTVTVNNSALNAASSWNFAGLTRNNRASVYFGALNLGADPGVGVGNIFFGSSPGALIGAGGDPNTSTTASILPFAHGGAAVGTTFVTWDSTTQRIVPLNLATGYTTTLAGSTANDNANINSSEAVAVGGQTINSLRMAPAVSITLSGGAGDVLSITSGAILNTSSPQNTTTIRSTISAPIAFGSAEGVLIAQSGAPDFVSPFGFGGLEISGVISGTNGVTKAGGGTLALSGANTYTGQTTLLAGHTLLFGDASGDGTTPSVFGLDTSAIVLTSGGNFVNRLYAAGAVNRTIDRDLLVIGGGSGLVGLGSVTTESLIVNGDITITNPTNSLANGFLSLEGDTVLAGAVVLNGRVQGVGGLRDQFLSFAVLNGNNTYSGGTNITGGTFAVGHDNAFGTGTVFVSTAGSRIQALGGARVLPNNFHVQADMTFQGTDAIDITGSFSLAGGAPRVLTISNTSPVTISGILGRGSLVKAGTGTLVLTNTNNDYTGFTTVRNGTLIIGGNALVGSGVLGTNPNTTVGSAGTVQLGDATTGIADNLALIASGAFTVARNVTVNNQNSNGTTTVGGSNTSGTATYSGQLTLNRNSNATRLTSASGGRVQFGGLITQTLAGAAVDVVGGGTVAVTNPTGNTYTGTTTVTDGTLLINNASGSALGSGNVTVSATGQLGVLSVADGGTGVGSFSGSLTVNPGGVVKAGNSTGLLTVGGGINLSAGATVEAEINGWTTAGVEFSQIISLGLISLANADLFIADNVVVPIGTTIVLIRNDSGAAVSGIFDTLPEGAFFTAGLNTFQITYVFNAPSSDGLANDVAITAVPEPTTIALMLGGLGVAGGAWWRRRQKSAESKLRRSNCA